MTARNFSFQAMSGRDIDQLALGLVRRYQPGVLKTGEAFDVHRFLIQSWKTLPGSRQFIQTNYHMKFMV